METLADYLQRQLRLRGWSDRELARRAKVSSSSVHRAISMDADKPARWDVLLAIAEALRVDPVAMLRMAGELPREPEQTTRERMLLRMYRQLPEEHQANLFFFAEYLFTQRSRLFPLLNGVNLDEDANEAANNQTD